MVIIVAGVAGSGKTMVGAMLAGRLPWLHSIAAWMDERIAHDEPAVICCSALKRPYRDILLDDRPETRLVFLVVQPEVLARRLAARHAHFFPAQLLSSQLDALEPLSPASARSPSSSMMLTSLPTRWPRSSGCCGWTRLRVRAPDLPQPGWVGIETTLPRQARFAAWKTALRAHQSRARGRSRSSAGGCIVCSVGSRCSSLPGSPRQR